MFAKVWQISPLDVVEEAGECEFARCCHANHLLVRVRTTFDRRCGTLRVAITYEKPRRGKGYNAQQYIVDRHS